MNDVIIYVSLLDEGVKVSRPVSAKRVKDNIYEILDENRDITCEYGEVWEFNKGDTVECSEVSGNLYAKRLMILDN